MILVDDLFARPFLSILDAVRTLAVEELYDVERIRDDLKENRLLYELGERSEDRYRERKWELEMELDAAERAREQLRSKSIEVRG
ncbi:protein gvpG [Halobacteriales archaeon QS_6_71_20]|nr:MAG: protein gvpG [Halobacteriales archaeon QS_6_71_20]